MCYLKSGNIDQTYRDETDQLKQLDQTYRDEADQLKPHKQNPYENELGSRTFLIKLRNG